MAQPLAISDLPSNPRSVRQRRLRGEVSRGFRRREIARGKGRKPVSLKGEAAEYLGLKMRQVAVNKERSDIFAVAAEPPGAGWGIQLKKWALPELARAI